LFINFILLGAFKKYYLIANHILNRLNLARVVSKSCSFINRDDKHNKLFLITNPRKVASDHLMSIMGLSLKYFLLHVLTINDLDWLASWFAISSVEETHH
jgi:hypothetical protein